MRDGAYSHFRQAAARLFFGRLGLGSHQSWVMIAGEINRNRLRASHREPNCYEPVWLADGFKILFTSTNPGPTKDRESGSCLGKPAQLWRSGSISKGRADAP